MTSPPSKKSRRLSRVFRGRSRRGASFPLPPDRINLPKSYVDVFGEVKKRIQQERLRVVVSANSALVVLYWDIGRMILARQKAEGWGAKIIDRLAADLAAEFPGMTGFSYRNLIFMRGFAEAYQERSIVKQLVSQLPWGHIIRLLQRVKNPKIRNWYMKKCLQQGWSRSVLEIQIAGRVHAREGKAITNFKGTMPPADSDMAHHVFKDPYLFDFLGTADSRREREIEQALVDHIQQFLLELGAGFAFVGRQVHLEFSSHDYYIDLLFYHLKLRRYVVVELKAVPFDPSFVGQLNVYLSAVDDLLKHPQDKPTIGLLLCQSKDKVVVEYALRDFRKPIGVAHWQTKKKEDLPLELKGNLPTVHEIEVELGSVKTSSLGVES